MPTRIHTARGLILLLVGPIVCACSPSTGMSTYPATGQVKWQGEPLADALVVFMPPGESASRRAAQAMTDVDGRFVMRTHVEKEQYVDGVQAGDYGVVITKLETVPDMRRAPRNLLPKKYSAAATSKLSAKVEPVAQNDFQFDLD